MMSKRGTSDRLIDQHFASLDTPAMTVSCDTPDSLGSKSGGNRLICHDRSTTVTEPTARLVD